MFRTKAALVPKRVDPPPLPPQNRRKRGGPVQSVSSTDEAPGLVIDATPGDETLTTAATTSGPSEKNVEIYPTEPDIPQLSQEDAVAKVAEYQAIVDEGRQDAAQLSYCPECYLPLHPDPKPEKLYIFLHALRYTTSLGCFETDMPVWAEKGWEWDRS